MWTGRGRGQGQRCYGLSRLMHSSDLLYRAGLTATLVALCDVLGALTCRLPMDRSRA